MLIFKKKIVVLISSNDTCNGRYHYYIVVLNNLFSLLQADIVWKYITLNQIKYWIVIRKMTPIENKILQKLQESDDYKFIYNDKDMKHGDKIAVDSFYELLVRDIASELGECTTSKYCLIQINIVCCTKS